MLRSPGVFALLLLGTLPACEKNGGNPNDAEEASDAPWGVENAEEVPGGWTTQDPGDDGVVAAADVAIAGLREALGDESLEMIKIQAAQTQVVAGTNYRLVMDVDGAGGARTISATVYEPVGGEPPRLTEHQVQE